MEKIVNLLCVLPRIDIVSKWTLNKWCLKETATIVAKDTVGYDFCYEWWLLKKPFFVAAFRSLYISGKIALRKRNLNSFHWPGNYFEPLFISEGGCLAKKQLQTDGDVNETATADHCQTLLQVRAKTCLDKFLLTDEVRSKSEIGW